MFACVPQVPGPVTATAPDLPGNLTPDQKATWHQVPDAVETGWQFDGNCFTPPVETPEPFVPDPHLVLASQARAAFEIADKTLMRCLRKGVQFPEEWVDWCDTLADIISHPQNYEAVPSHPPYPQGS